MALDFYVLLPYDWLSWLGLILPAGLLVFGMVKKSRPVLALKHRNLLLFIGLLFLQLVFSRILLIRLPNEGIFPVPGLPVEPLAPVLALLIAIPWVLAAGSLGLLWSLILAGCGGLVMALAITHHLFTILEFCGLAFLFNLAIRQNYRFGYYRLFRHPLGASVVLAIFFIPFYVLSAFFSTPGSLEARIDYALTQYWVTILARTIELLLAGVIAEVPYLLRKSFWHRPASLTPSPEESSLSARILFGTAPLVIILILTLTVGDWMVAGGAARQMIQERLASTAKSAADSLPDFLAAGQNLIRTLATPDLLLTSKVQLNKLLEQKLSAIPLFDQMVLVDEQGNIISSYPDSAEKQSLVGDEKSALSNAIKGVVGQSPLIPPLTGKNSYRISFIAPILDANNPLALPKGAILGRAPLANVFTNPTINGILDLQEWKGEGQFIDEKKIIIYHPVASQVGTPYAGRIPTGAEFFDEISGSGVRRLVYFQPVKGPPWSVVLTVPAEHIQRLSLNIAFPLLSILTVISLLTLIFLAISLRRVTRSLKNLSTEATMISRGQLDNPLAFGGEDEVGQLGRAFEQMRQSLKARLDDLNRLLRVSQGVASSLKVEIALPPILEAVLQEGVCSARIVLAREIAGEGEPGRVFAMGRGPKAETFSYLDNQLFEMVRTQTVMTIPNLNRVRRLNIPQGKPQPGAVIAMALRQENHYHGLIWIAYDQPHNFNETEVNFLGTLAGQAALAASNANLYDSAEIGRQHLSAVLASSPEPVLVIDDKLRLVIINPAASETPGLVIGGEAGRPIRDVVANLDLLELIIQPLEEHLASREITLPGNRVFSASVSPVYVNKKPVGRICILQNITQYKELDKVKSDFVATVSHDLRSPLTLMRGYATMLNMVGELNDQQKSFQRKIISGVENMTRLVNNLLDIGRLDAGFPLQRERVIVQEVISQVLSGMQPTAVQKNIKVEHQGAAMPPVYLEADRALLQQAITNLVDNALKYTPVNGHVQVGLLQKMSIVHISVKDSGIGIAPLDLPHVFEKFYRSGRRDMNQQKSGGLGLAIVKSIVEHHGGKVQVESQLGKGSVFTIELPINPPNQD